MIVSGRLKQRSYETREGETRQVVELEVDEVGPSLKYATAKVSRVNRSGASASGSYTNHGGALDAMQPSNPGTVTSGFGESGEPPF